MGPGFQRHRLERSPRRCRGRTRHLPYAAPARAEDLSRPPPAYLDVGSAETFRDETGAYAGRLWQSGTQCALHVWPGGFHGFDEFAPQARLSRRAKHMRRQWLSSLLAAGQADR